MGGRMVEGGRGGGGPTTVSLYKNFSWASMMADWD